MEELDALIAELAAIYENDKDMLNQFAQPTKIEVRK